ncbi:MAG: hypothetical protein KDD04_05620 [Sinomicrobium sp.]|nr:hypothetical protein [Sinomicrobium sp.]
MLKIFLVGIPTLWYAIVPPLVDISSTHVFHPDWPGHARFHMMWLLVTTALLSFFALYCLLRGYPDKIIGARIASIISIGVYSGFFVSFFTMNLFGGTLQDQNGVESIMGINANLFVFIPLFIMLCAGAVFAFSSNEDKK